MRESKTNPSFLPTPAQAILLQAVLSDGEDAVEAWKKWRKTVRFDEIDPASFRLLPLAWYNICRFQLDDPVMERVKGTYRMVWSRNQMLLHRLAKILRIFEKAEIPTMLLKGTALIQGVYPDCGLRPMEDLDLLIPRHLATKGVAVLSEAGWTEKFHWPETPDTIFLQSHAMHFEDASKQKLDLHWNMMAECRWEEADAPFWEASSLWAIEGAPTRVLNPTDLLLHLCVHGVRWSPLPTLRWIPDSLFLLRSMGTMLDWERLIHMGSEYRLNLTLGKTLRYLKEEWDAAIPGEILDRIGKARITGLERLEFRIITHRHRITGRWPKLWYFLSRMIKSASFWPRLLGYPGYLRDVLNLRSVWQIPLYKHYRMKTNHR